MHIIIGHFKTQYILNNIVNIYLLGGGVKYTRIYLHSLIYRGGGRGKLIP